MSPHAEVAAADDKRERVGREAVTTTEGQPPFRLGLDHAEPWHRLARLACEERRALWRITPEDAGETLRRAVSMAEST